MHPYETLNGAIATPFMLGPGESNTVTFALAWHFPTYPRFEWWEYKDWIGRDHGHYYSNWWEDAEAVADYVTAELPRLEYETRLYKDTFYATTLPHWLLDRINSQNAIMQSKTFYRSEDNFIGGNEGTNEFRNSCPFNNLYVWGYAQSHARLFPEIAQRMREQEFEWQHDGGKINTRLTNIHDIEGRNFDAAFDAMCFNVLGAWREHLNNSDKLWLKTWWPNIKKSMDYLIRNWDPDEDGVMGEKTMGNTLDCHLSGVSSWLGTLYLASLEASANMARIMGEDELAERYTAIYVSGAEKQDALMWNGEYYEQIMDTSMWGRADYGDGVAIDMLLGEWWANQVGLGPYYPEAHRRSALEAIFKYNFRPDFYGINQFPRKFVDEEDAGMLMITWPEGTTRPEKFTVYSDEVMSGFEYSYAATCLQNGLPEIALAVLKSAYDRYDGRLRTGLSSGDNNAWGYSGNPFGDDEAGKFYSRAMTIWSVLLAMQGFEYDGPNGYIGFAPIWQPEEHKSFFSAGNAWGLFSQSRSEDKQLDTIDVRYGSLKLNTVALEVSEDKNVSRILMRKGDDDTVTIPFEQTRKYITVDLISEVTLDAGESLEFALLYHVEKRMSE